MYGASIEKDVQHNAFRSELLRRSREMQRSLENGKQRPSRRPLVQIFLQLALRPSPRTPASRSPLAPGR